MAALSPARSAARRLVTRVRQREARVRDLARTDEELASLAAADRALAMRLALGAVATAPLLDELVDGRLRRPSSLEPRVRDALRVAAFELLYLSTPEPVAVSQGVELVRAVTPRAAGLANAVLRRLAGELRPQVHEARERCMAGEARPDDCRLVSGLPAWLVERLEADRGGQALRALSLAQLEPAPVFVAANGLRHGEADLAALLTELGCDPRPVPGLPGSFELGDAAPLAPSGLVESADLVVADRSAQLVCRLAAPATRGSMLELGQGRGTKSVLLAAGAGVARPSRLEGVDTVAYKVRVARRRMRAAGLSDVVGCHELDARSLAGDAVPPALAGPCEAVLVDAPCSGTGTMRRHPEIAASLTADAVASLATLQRELLEAAARRVAPGGRLVYATCSVLREEDEDVVSGFLAGEWGRHFALEPVGEAPCCQQDRELARVVGEVQTPDGFLLTLPQRGGADGHFCACLVRRS